jgi:hypothetical protein
MPIQGQQQANPYSPAGKNVGARSAQEIQWDIDNQPNTGWTNRPQALQQELADVNYTNANRNKYNELIDAGYNPSSPYTSMKNWGAYDTLGGIGEAEAQKQYQQLLDYGKSTGDWSPMEQFQTAAESGDRKYHRSGFMGTGISISPLGMMGLFAGGIGALGSAFPLAASAGAGAGAAAPAAAAAGNGLSAAGNAFSGISGYNAASPFAGALSQGSSLGSMAGLGASGNLVGQAALGLGVNTPISALDKAVSVLNKAKAGASAGSKLSNLFGAGGGGMGGGGGGGSSSGEPLPETGDYTNLQNPYEGQGEWATTKSQDFGDYISQNRNGNRFFENKLEQRGLLGLPQNNPYALMNKRV